MRSLVALLLLWSAPVWAEDASPRFSLGLSESDRGTASYGAVAFDLSIGSLSFGRPRSALDDPAFAAPGLFLATARSQAASAAVADRLGPGLLYEAAPSPGFTLSGSWHGQRDQNAGFVAVSGRYVADAPDALGQIAIYGGAETGGAEDVYRLGTSLTRGRTTAGVDLTTEQGPSRRQISGVYLGLAVTEALSLGLSGEVESDRGGAARSARFGLGAAMDLGAGRVVSGAIGDVGGNDPVFGLSLGLQF